MPSDMKFKLDIKQFKNSIRERLRLFLLKHKDKIDYFKQFVALSIIYGLVINYVVWSVFGLDFNWITFPGYGMLAYLVKVEFVSLVKIFVRR